jgi:hypothetical protein
MEDQNNIPVNNEEPEAGSIAATPPPAQPEAAEPEPPASANNGGYDDEVMTDRLERLGGEPAPVITPEEFARLQQEGRVNIDSRGRVRTTRRNDNDAGVSLRKRRAWYA